MPTIVGYVKRQYKEVKEFHALILIGGLEMVRLETMRKVNLKSA